VPRENSDTSIAHYLAALRAGDPAAESALWALVYDELRRVAHQILRREQKQRDVQTTALVHEAYLRLFKDGRIEASHRRHFFALVARVMRRILVDGARARQAEKRGGEDPASSLSELGDVAAPDTSGILELDLALHDLARVDERKAAIVELHYFGGYEFAEIGQLMSCSEKTVRRQWLLAKAWLFNALNPSGQG
jgi:RNA polymerase sigma factor (TIGR02999 family)